MAYSLWRVNVLDFSIADELFDGLEGEIWIDSAGTVAKQQGHVMDLACFA